MMTFLVRLFGFHTAWSNVRGSEVEYCLHSVTSPLWSMSRYTTMVSVVPGRGAKKFHRGINPRMLYFEQGPAIELVQ
jgi:hypothetical protein